MDETDPEIVFEDRACNHCRQYEVMEKVRKCERTNLPWIYNEIRKYGKVRDYDCLLGLSGGVDSSLVLHHLVENGIRPLCFSVDNGWNTPESDENIMHLVETLRVPFIRYVLNIPNFQNLQRRFIKSGTANLEIPTDHILMAASYEVAEKYGIKYIISGGNIATESIMPPAWGYNARDLTFIQAIGNTDFLPTCSLAKYLYHRFIRGVKIVNLLDYYEYDREKAISLLSGKYGYKPYGGKHCENVFTAWFQGYWLPVRFGFDKRKAHYSSLINSGQMTREAAIARLMEPLDFPKIDFPPDIVDGLYVGKGPTRDYREFKNSEWQWGVLSNIYGIISGRR